MKVCLIFLLAWNVLYCNCVKESQAERRAKKAKKPSSRFYIERIGLTGNPGIEYGYHNSGNQRKGKNDKNRGIRFHLKAKSHDGNVGVKRQFDRSGVSACKTKVDLGFLIDGSGSVEAYGKGNYQKCLDFVKAVTRAFVISPTDARVGAIVFSSDSELQFDFTQYTTQQQVEDAINRIKYPAKTTYCGKGLTMAGDKLFTNSREGVSRILLVLTDGRSHDDVVAPSEKLRQSGVTIFAIGLGQNYQVEQLKAMASKEPDEHVFTVDFPEMNTIVTTLQQKMCTAAVNAVAGKTTRNKPEDLMTSFAKHLGYQLNRQTITASGGMSSSGGMSASSGGSVSGSINGASTGAYGGAAVGSAARVGGGCDLGFMVDLSSSVSGEGNFERVMKFVTSIFHSFTLGGGVRYGLVVFGSSIKIVFGFTQYTSITEVDSAIASVTLIGGSCAAGAALTQCQSALFSGDSGGKARLLVVLMAGESTDNVSRVAGSLKTAGVKIIAVGMSSSVDQSQLTTMAFSSSFMMRVGSFDGLNSIAGKVSTLVSQAGGISISGGGATGGSCDLAFMLDASSSIQGEANFDLCIQFIKSVFHSFGLGGSIRFALVIFGNSPEVVFDFSKYSSISEIDTALSQVKPAGGSCAAGKALSKCQSSLFANAEGGAATGGGASAGVGGGASVGAGTGAGAGPGLGARLLVVMMAGKSSDSVDDVSRAMKQNGVKIICVGMGTDVDGDQMKAMASASSYFLSVASFGALSTKSSEIISLIGQAGGISAGGTGAAGMAGTAGGVTGGTGVSSGATGAGVTGGTAVGAGGGGGGIGVGGSSNGGAVSGGIAGGASGTSSGGTIGGVTGSLGGAGMGTGVGVGGAGGIGVGGQISGGGGMTGAGSKPRKSKKRRWTTNQFSRNGNLSFERAGRQIFDRGKQNIFGGESSKNHTNRKFTVLRITFVKHALNRSFGKPHATSFMKNVKGSGGKLNKSFLNSSRDTVKATTMLSLSDVNQTAGKSKETIPLNDHLSEKLNNSNYGWSLPRDLPAKVHFLPLINASGKIYTSRLLHHRSEPNVVLEAKLNPLRIGIRLEDGKERKPENSQEIAFIERDNNKPNNKKIDPDSTIKDQESLQQVLKAIDSTPMSSSLTKGGGEDAEKDNKVLAKLNEEVNDNVGSSLQNTDTSEKEEGKSGKVHIQATSKKGNSNGTEVKSAGVSITTESKGLGTDNLMKLLLTKLLGNDIAEALKEKVAEELKSDSKQPLETKEQTRVEDAVSSHNEKVSNLIHPNDHNSANASLQPDVTKVTSSSNHRINIQGKIANTPSFDMASTTPTGTSVESPPGTSRGTGMSSLNSPSDKNDEFKWLPYPSIGCESDTKLPSGGCLTSSNPPPPGSTKMASNDGRFMTSTTGTSVESPPKTSQGTWISRPSSPRGKNNKFEWLLYPSVGCESDKKLPSGGCLISSKPSPLGSTKMAPNEGRPKMAPSKPSKMDGFASTTPTSVSVESPPGTLMGVDMAINEGENEEEENIGIGTGTNGGSIGGSVGGNMGAGGSMGGNMEGGTSGGMGAGTGGNMEGTTMSGNVGGGTGGSMGTGTGGNMGGNVGGNMAGGVGGNVGESMGGNSEGRAAGGMGGHIGGAGSSMSGGMTGGNMGGNLGGVGGSVEGGGTGLNMGGGGFGGAMAGGQTGGNMGSSGGMTGNLGGSNNGGGFGGGFGGQLGGVGMVGNMGGNIGNIGGGYQVGGGGIGGNGGGGFGGGGMGGGIGGSNMGGVGAGSTRGMEVVLDLGFLIDGSSAVGNEQNFRQILNFVSGVGHAFAVGHDITRIGVVVYSLEAFVIFNFHTYFDMQNIDQALSTVQYPGTDGPGTYIGRGLRVTRHYLFAASGRGRLPQTLVIVAAGRSIDDVIAPSMQLRSYGIEIFCVGVGNIYSKLQLHAMSSFPDSEHIFRADYATIGNTAQQVVTKVLKGISIHFCRPCYSGHQQYCDFCPSEFQDVDEDDEDTISERRHHRHHGTPDSHLLNGERRNHGKPNKTSRLESQGDYELGTSNYFRNRHHGFRRHNSKGKESNTLLLGQSDLHHSGKEGHDAAQAIQEGFGEYKYDVGKMTVEDYECKDYSDECSQYASRGYCSDYAPTASIGTINMMCKRACGACNGPNSKEKYAYEVLESDPFYKKTKIGHSHGEKN